MRRLLVGCSSLCLCALAYAQSTPNVSQVLGQALVTNRTGVNGAPQNLFGIYTTAVTADPRTQAFGGTVTNAANYLPANSIASQPLSAALAQNIAIALSLIPLTSPSSGVILKKDPASGADLPVSGTLGPIFTQRAESIGKGKFYLGFTHQNFHFTKYNGQNLNGISILYKGGDPSGVLNPSGTSTTTAPATFNYGMDVRLSQDIAFLTYGVTDKLDVSVGLPMVHSAVSATAYNGIVYSGSGDDFNTGNQCWCINTLTPGQKVLSTPYIGASSASRTGFGDLIVRAKDTVIQTSNMALAAGLDVRFPTGDASNFQGTGAYILKPFVAASLYSQPIHGIVFAPHFDLGFQRAVSQQGALFSPVQVVRVGGVSTTTLGTGDNIGNIPNVLSWGVGTEVAFGNHNTLIVDFLGNQIYNAAFLQQQTVASSFASPALAGIAAPRAGFTSVGTNSFGQYSGAFGYKVRILGNLLATFQALVRFDDNGLTARLTPLYGLGYSF